MELTPLEQEIDRKAEELAKQQVDPWFNDTFQRVESLGIRFLPVFSELPNLSAQVSLECVDGHPTWQPVAVALVEYLRELVQVGTVIEDDAFGNLK